MDPWLQLIVSALAGAVAGGVVSLRLAVTLAERSERGRLRAVARAYAATAIDHMHALVEAERVRQRSGSGPRRLNDDDVHAFLRDLVLRVGDLPHRAQQQVRRALETLMGPTAVDYEWTMAELAAEKRDGMDRAYRFLIAVEHIERDRVLDKGALGRALSRGRIEDEYGTIVTALNSLGGAFGHGRRDRQRRGVGRSPASRQRAGD